MHTFRTSRHFDATPEAVFAALQAPERLARWWGPEGFTNTFEVFEFRPGGMWRFVMHGPDGRHYPNESVFAEIVPHRRVRIEHRSLPHFVLCIDLAPAPGGGTLLSWEQAFSDADVAQAVRHIVEPANEQNLDRLGRELQGSPN